MTLVPLLHCKVERLLSIFLRFTASLTFSLSSFLPPHLKPKETSQVKGIEGITPLSSTTLLL